jgi:hypothetical protein cdivTM_09431
MITHLYSFYDLPFDHDVCHVYEHLVLQRFLALLENHGLCRAFVGNVHGQTIESTIFFELEVYTAHSKQLFETALKETKPLSSAATQRVLGHIEAEMQTTIVVDQPVLDIQLTALAKHINGATQTSIITPPSPLSITESPHVFDNITLSIEVPDASDDATHAFFCFYPALLDIARDGLQDLAIYPSKSGTFTAYYDGNAVAQQFTIKKNVPSSLTALVENILRTFPVHQHRHAIAHMAKVFATDPTYFSIPLHFYETTNTRATREILAQSITPAHLHTILSTATVTVSKS